MTKVTGQGGATNNLAAAFGNAAGDARASAAGMAGVLGAYGNVDKNAAGQTYTYSSDSNDYAKRGGTQDISEEDDK